ncbi:MAG: GTPase ObgE [Bacteroidetes bacterium 4572_77]|nr:MAG: GTPase ObgE [Bacteroidetes bacterium 4572_77]
MNSNFVDYIKVYCRSGRGGAGSVHFHREKYITEGGPDGGDGGKGGDIIVVGNSNLWTLLHLRYTRHVRADSGESGGANRRFGKDGADAVLELPLGTVIKDFETGEVICEVMEDGERHVVLPGGKGGLGNDHFKNSVRQSPTYAQPGQDFKEQEVLMELKVLADVGLVGFPNAGKSTLLSSISAAKPEIADYPFTTMAPNLGIVPYRDHRSFVMADIPGIIQGAHEGKGLGIRFLRHIERNSVLLFMVPGTADDVRKEYDILLHELKMFNPELMDKEKFLVVTKSDLLDKELEEMISVDLQDVPHLYISAVAQKGLDELKDILWKMMVKK